MDITLKLENGKIIDIHFDKQQIVGLLLDKYKLELQVQELTEERDSLWSFIKRQLGL